MRGGQRTQTQKIVHLNLKIEVTVSDRLERGAASVGDWFEEAGPKLRLALERGMGVHGIVVQALEVEV